MSERLSSIEFAHRRTEPESLTSKPLREWVLEVTEAVLLSFIAVATAFCGYHSARWEGRQSLLYGDASRLRVEAAIAASDGGQKRLLDVVTFNTWIGLKGIKNEKVAALYVQRFSSEYRVAFEAWLKTDPFNNPNAPAGPAYMPEYHNALLLRSQQLDREAAAAFTAGTQARERAEQYVRITVFLATVMFLVAVAQRFRLPRVRTGFLLVAAVLMILALANVAIYPRV